jgi:3-isopropylmalate/(R)-2-methylmalate dehydratase small subunit
VIADSFARIFYRNCINVGLLALESPAASAAIRHGDRLEVDSAAGAIRNLSTNETYSFTPIPPFVQQILDLGGLVPYVKKRLRNG